MTTRTTPIESAARRRLRRLASQAATGFTQPAPQSAMGVGMGAAFEALQGAGEQALRFGAQHFTPAGYRQAKQFQTRAADEPTGFGAGFLRPEGLGPASPEREAGRVAAQMVGFAEPQSIYQKADEPFIFQALGAIPPTAQFGKAPDLRALTGAGRQAAREAAPAVRRLATEQAGAVGKGAGKGKEPWEMTVKEYGETVASPYLREQLRKSENAIALNRTPKDSSWMKQKHGAVLTAIDKERKATVQKALSEGKPVPDEVLADYPDLKPPAAESAVAPRKTAAVKAYEAAYADYAQAVDDLGAGADPQKKAALARAKVALSDATRRANEEREVSRKATPTGLAGAPEPPAVARAPRGGRAYYQNLVEARKAILAKPNPEEAFQRYVAGFGSGANRALRKGETYQSRFDQYLERARVSAEGQTPAEPSPLGPIARPGEFPEPSPQPVTASSSAQAVQPPPALPPQGPPPPGAGGVPPRSSGVPPVATGGGAPKPQGQVGPPKTNPFGFRPVQAGLTKSQEIGNQIRSVVRLGGLNEEEVATPIMMERSRVRPVIDAKAARFGTLVDERARALFQPDKQGRIPSLAGIDPQVPGAPTIQDIAARLPSYESALTPEQAAFIREIGDEVQQYKAMLSEMGIDVPMPRADVMDGGFYLPRGKAEIEGADLPVKVRAGRLGAGAGKPGFLKAASFTSQAQGIEKGFEYPPLADALRSYVAQSGSKALDTYTVNLLKTATNASGDVIGRSPKMRLLETKPQIVLAREQAAQAFKDARKALQDAKKALQGEELVTRVGTQQASAETSAGLAAQVSQVQQGLRAQRASRRTQLEQAVTTADVDFKAAQLKYGQVNEVYNAALKKVTDSPPDEGTIGFEALRGYSFPDAMTNAVNKVLRSEGEPTGKGAGLLRGINTLNSWYRGVRATGDDSALMIQGLLAAGADQRAAAHAWKANFKAWGLHGQDVLARYIRDYDKTAASTNRLTSDQWIQSGLHLGGAETEFSLGQGATAGVGRMPLVRVANRAFGYTGDVLRLKWADDQLAAEINGLGPLRKPRTFQEIEASGDLDRIADAANKMTGWSPNKAAGDVGDVLLFAPRFFQARLETVGKAALSLRPGGATLDRRMARNALLKTTAWGTLLTVAVNEAMGNETDFRPVVQNKQGQWQYNTNFMRIRWNGRDWSIFGPWDSLARIIVNTGLGVQNPKAAFQSWEAMLSGVVGIPLDVAQLFARGYGGEEVTPLDLAKLFLEDLVPFGAGEIGAFGTQVAKGVAEGDAAEVAKGVGSEVLTFGGTKSSPLTKEERGEASGRTSRRPTTARQAVPSQSSQARRRRLQAAGVR